MMKPEAKMQARKRNALAATLAKSVCVFRVKVTESISLDEKPLLILQEAGAKFFMDGTWLEVTIPHDRIDAFGGLLALSLSTDVQKHIVPTALAAGSFTCERENCRMLQCWQPQVPSKSGATLTQRFIGELLLALPEVQEIDICVACDDLGNLNSETLLGNSLGIVNIKRRRAEILASGDRSMWLTFLKKRAGHALQLEGTPPAPSPILVSSVGNLQNFSWCSRLFAPDNFLMFPTPATDATHVVLWSNGRQQVLTVGVRRGIDANILADVRHAWERSCP